MPPTPEFVEVIFRGPTRFLEAFGQTVERGETARFDRSEIFSLQSNDRIEIEVLGPVADASPADKAAKPAAVKGGEGQQKSNQEEEA